MMLDDDPPGGVLVWFEDNAAGRAALARAHGLARLRDAHLAVVTVATHERVVGCGRCLTGTVLWNLEMQKIAHEELRAARLILDGADDVSYAVVVGDPVDAITAAAARTAAAAVVLPRLRRSRLAPPNRRHVCERLRGRGPWQVFIGPGGSGGDRSPTAADRPPA